MVTANVSVLNMEHSLPLHLRCHGHCLPARVIVDKWTLLIILASELPTTLQAEAIDRRCTCGPSVGHVTSLLVKHETRNENKR